MNTLNYRSYRLHPELAIDLHRRARAARAAAIGKAMARLVARLTPSLSPLSRNLHWG